MASENLNKVLGSLPEDIEKAGKSNDFYINKIERSTVSFPSTSNWYKNETGIAWLHTKESMETVK